ncbi:MAG TPA: transketolase C-terminal domain-containing protein [Candidatus Sulfotelmatobacter sp.]|nr:transketolase C-terminal domain-containing protein [Candidatus Sulfotelmatobacter sp.]
MRTTFANTLTEIARADRRVLLLTADLGYMALEPFAEANPDQFINVGVAEQNMLGIATGLSDGGYLPFAYSIAPFASLRPYEFIRNGPVLHHLPVRIVGVGAGFEYGTAGPTHHGIDDAAALRPQAGLLIVSPADAQQMRTALLATWDYDGPIYYRIGKDEKTFVPGLDGRFRVGRAETVREGNDLAFVVMGALAADVCAAADALAAHGLSASVAVVSTFNPAPVADVARLAEEHRLLVSVEAQYVNGGLGSFVAETIAEAGSGARLLRIGVERPAQGRSGSQGYYHRLHGLDREAIVRRVLAVTAGEPV